MTAIENGKIILCDGVAEHRVLLIRGDRIAGLAESADGADRVIDARGRYVMPGLIDVHSDRIEQYIQPRPTSQMDFELALRNVSASF
jgi:alpha-D-ribose 1-methylphosphonate 5-triphosphate diphosphatase